MLECLERKQNYIVLSRSDRLSKEFIQEAIAPHVRAMGAVAQFVDAPLTKSAIYKHEVIFGNGSRIIALPASPDTARSYEGNVLLDEFAFHRDARRIYEAIEPTITRGYNLAIISTPNSQQGTYYQLAKESGLVDGHAYSNRWSAHKTDIHEAILQGFCDRNGKPLNAGELRDACLDDEMWQQEYCCTFLSTATQWISPELFSENVSAEASAGEPDPAYRNLYAGWDIARNRNFSVIWIMELLGDVSITRGVIEMRDVRTPDQMNIARALMPQIQRMVIDKTGMGLAIFEQLETEYGSHRIEGVHFTLQAKQELAVLGKRRMEERRTRIPDTDIVRNSFRSVKKIVTATGQMRFDAEHDEKFGHADHWWSFCLAESAHAGQVSEDIFVYQEDVQISEDLDRLDSLDY